MTNTFKLNKELIENLPDELSNKTNLDLANSPYTTNRILEIPQDIKLELNDGTLTLKAGSKVYVPNGFESNGTTPKFDVVVIESDSTIKNGANQQEIILSRNGNITAGVSSAWTYSGDTPPTVSTTFALWYDTANNKIRQTNNNGSTWLDGYSLPIALSTSNTAQYVSIDQIFNGFGYIGSTVFLLPGLKLEIPNGRNEDGSYINNIVTIPSVNVNITNQNGLCQFVCTDTGSIAIGSRYVYDDTKNLLKRLSDGVYFSRFILADVLYEGGKIIQFTPRNVDSVANSNASNFSQAGRSYLSGLGMPSDRYIDLTLGTNGSTYKAPASGKFCIYMIHGNNANIEFITMNCNGRNKIVQNNYAEYHMTNEIELKKGDIVSITYSVTGSTTYFRFYYTEGENNNV